MLNKIKQILTIRLNFMEHAIIMKMAYSVFCVFTVTWPSKQKCKPVNTESPEILGNKRR